MLTAHILASHIINLHQPQSTYNGIQRDMTATLELRKLI